MLAVVRSVSDRKQGADRRDVIVVSLRDGDLVGRGAAAGVSYRNETSARMREQIEAVRERIESRIDREELRNLFPAGGARNAVDCALWELDAKRAGRAVWELASCPAPRPLLTIHTWERMSLDGCPHAWSSSRALAR